MTAKRFTVKQRQGATIYSIEDYYGELPLNEGIYYKSNADKLCEWLNTQYELLNTLYNENEQLKETIETQNFNYENAKGIIHSSEHQIQQLQDENEKLKKDNEWLFKCVENQSALIHELDNTIMAYNMERNITIKLTEKDLKTLDKALSYYTHQKVEE